MLDSLAFKKLRKGYTLHFHSAGSGKETPRTSILLLAGKGYTLHVHTAGVERDTPCTSMLLVKEYTLDVHNC
jgi:hypothetical protein